MSQDAIVTSAPPSPDRLYRGLVALCLALYLALAGAYVVRLPAMAGPDEEEHLRYVEVLREHWRLPVLPRLALRGQDHLVAEQAQHPPLYYAVVAVASYAFPDLRDPAAQKALKLISVLLGLGAVLLTSLVARRLWPGDVVRPVAATGFMALLPNIGYLSAVLNNTSGALLASALALYLLYRALEAPPSSWRPWLGVGLTVALGMLAKITAIWLLPTVVVAWLLYGRARGVSWRQRLTTGAAVLLPVAVLVGLWLLRNVLQFGELMPERVLDRRYLPDGFAVIFFQPFAALLLLQVVIEFTPLSAVAPFWLMRTDLGDVVGCIALALLVGPALVGLHRARQDRGRDTWRPREPRGILLLAGAAGLLGSWFVATEAVLHDWNTGLYAGRYALECLPAAALLWAAGMGRLLPTAACRAWAVGVGLVALLAASLYVQQFVVQFFADLKP